jgi:hypothetical protein
VPEYPIFSPISSQEGSRVAINPDRVSSIIETGPRRVNINLPAGGTVTVAMTLEHVIAHLRGAHVAQEEQKAAESPRRPVNAFAPETLGAKQRGERSARNPHAAFDEAGAGNVAWARWCNTRNRGPRTKGPSRPRPLDVDRQRLPVEIGPQFVTWNSRHPFNLDNPVLRNPLP